MGSVTMDIMATPGYTATVDNQGKADTCSHHAVAKAAVDDLDDKDFDADQKSVFSYLYSEDICRRWPSYFNGKEWIMQNERDKKYYEILLNISKSSFEEFKDLSQRTGSGKFVGVWHS